MSRVCQRLNQRQSPVDAVIMHGLNDGCSHDHAVRVGGDLFGALWCFDAEANHDRQAGGFADFADLIFNGAGF